MPLALPETTISIIMAVAIQSAMVTTVTVMLDAPILDIHTTTDDVIIILITVHIIANTLISIVRIDKGIGMGTIVSTTGQTVLSEVESTCLDLA